MSGGEEGLLNRKWEKKKSRAKEKDKKEKDVRTKEKKEKRSVGIKEKVTER